ncbi:hypothetical protein KSD_49610 [Ktedonobacter sp. SOSP1-85]|uniref:AfsR/SARP family transcriptional regulator n=1 Tax=Ktedonobacter sp. SOSP1-85 TaxID=2778367 RepID=UPI001915262D|nr:BTAD domain-containing putative transcriptional regulator [Ktedonobacter sp. SOSP1-85]GHO77190.1 hypothetical protein KSD_49610 [Ktedonobacter sp. SOSP1-85]
MYDERPEKQRSKYEDDESSLLKAMSEESSPLLRVFLLGPFRAEWLTPSQDPHAWESRTSARSLFKLLLCAPGRQASKAQLAGILWPESAEDKARESLRSATKVLGKVLTTTTGEKLLDTSQRDLLKLADQPRLWVDVDAFERCVTQAVQYEDPKNAVSLWQEAKELLGGPFLVEDRHQEWITHTWMKARRQDLLKDRRKMIRSLADAYIEIGQLSVAEELLSNHLIRFPTDQDALLRLLVLLVQQGCPDEALLLYAKLQQKLSLAGKSPSHHITRFMAHLQDLLKNFGNFHAHALLPPSAISSSHLREGSLPIREEAEIPRFSQETERQDITMPRRQLLGLFGLAALAVPQQVLNNNLSSQLHYTRGNKETLHHLAQATVLCLHLSEGDQLGLAEHVLWSYLPGAETLAQQPSEHQKQAAALVSQGYLIAASLVGHHNDLEARQRFSEQAWFYGRLADDPTLQVAALRQLAVTFDYLDCTQKVLQTYQRTLPLLDDVPPRLRACIYAALSGAYAQLQQKQDAYRFIGLAYEQFPEKEEREPTFLRLVNANYHTIILWDGLNHLELGEARIAEKVLAQIDVLGSKTQIPERIRIELLNYRSKAFIAVDELEQACQYLELAIQASLALKSKRRLQEGFAIYQQLQKKWPDERNVRALGDFFMQGLIHHFQ